jgi:short-subunit dehydrogenase
MDIAGKVVILTGASAGIGLATARLLAGQNTRLVLVARSAGKLKALAEEIGQLGHEALSIPTDMCNQAAVVGMVEQAFQHFGHIDVLINNAGQAAAGTVAEVCPEDFQKILELNVFGCLYAIQAVTPKMRLGGGGLIINVSSMVSKMHIPGLGAYAASKAALNMLSDTLRGELSAENIRVVSVFPRITATDFGRNSLGNRQMRQEQRSGAGSGPHNRTSWGQVPDTAELVAEKILEAARTEPAEMFMEA